MLKQICQAVKLVSFIGGVILISGLTGGCAYCDKNVALNHIDSGCDMQFRSHEKVHILKADDCRGGASSRSVGCVHGYFGSHSADVVCDREVGEWVQSCIKDNLIKAGVKVDNMKTRHGLGIDIKIITLNCEIPHNMQDTINAMMLGPVLSSLRSRTMKAQVELKIIIRYNGVTFYERTFSGKASRSSLLGTSDDYEGVLQPAMKECLEELMPVLIYEISRKLKTKNIADSSDIVVKRSPEKPQETNPPKENAALVF